ncbi:G-protein coupled receptor dmsr-1-like [Planococcus citri]|uniref:G-protein coupled receptor dmsr-1-like n=1 Tax=Planococcus citri TaxID=170843 RepID=UPI0031F91960
MSIQEQEQSCTEFHTPSKIVEYYLINVKGYVDIPICIIGSILNLLNIIVFTRKNMISPVNKIFTHLASADLLMLLLFIPYTWLNCFEPYTDGGWPYQQAFWYLCCSTITNTFYFMSVFLTVMLSVWRHIAIVHPLKERQWCSMKMTRNVVIAGYLTSFLLSTPIYLSAGIKHVGNNQTQIYVPRAVDDSNMFVISRIINSVLYQLLPAVALPIFSYKLIFILRAKKGHQQYQSPSADINNIRNTKTTEMRNKSDRSIVLLLTVVTLHVISKLPTGIVDLLYLTYGRANKIDWECYYNVSVIFDTMTCVTLSVTFIIYYTMGNNFRITFNSLFCTRKKCEEIDTDQESG